MSEQLLKEQSKEHTQEGYVVSERMPIGRKIYLCSTNGIYASNPFSALIFKSKELAEKFKGKDQKIEKVIRVILIEECSL